MSNYRDSTKIDNASINFFNEVKNLTKNWLRIVTQVITDLLLIRMSLTHEKPIKIGKKIIQIADERRVAPISPNPWYNN